MPTYRVYEATAEAKARLSHCMDTRSDPSLAFALASADAVYFHNQGVDLAAIGQYGASEQNYLKALKIKKKILGKDAISTAHSHYTLGELYTAIDRLDDAEKHLAIAVRIRNADVQGPTIDAAAARENLAVVYEMKGDLVAAKKMRKSTGKLACANNKNCPQRVFNKSQLRQCAKCTAIFYCGPLCQKADWRRHKIYCHKLEPPLSSV